MTFPVTFLPTGKTVRVPPGTTLLQAAVQAGLLIHTPCGGGGTCGKCRMRIRAGEVPAGGSSQHLTAEQLEAGWRLACVTRVTGPLEAEVPATSLLARLDTILVDGVPVPIRRDPHRLGEMGVAFDLGTTTVAGALFDLHTGLERASHAVMNRQIPLGDDVISRIHTVRQTPSTLARLQTAAIETLNEILDALCDACGETPGAIRRVTVAGNTAMQQLLLGIDPSPLGEAPFAAAFTDAQTTGAARLGLKVAADATLTVFPQIGGFVGGDTVAGLLASRFDSLTHPTLLVDIGTNGEIALFTGNALLAASSAAGPAFEGARIRQGMRAVPGAIDQIWMQDGDLRCHVINDADPCGLCGSALVDAVAVLLQAGLIDETGLLEPPAAAPQETRCALRERLIPFDHAWACVLARDARGEPLVMLTQRDIRELQLAAGAIRTGIEVLLARANLTPRDLDALLLAGGFGNYIRRENALRIGLLPPVHELAVRFVGNASLSGAKRALLAQAELDRAQQLRNRVTHVELAADPRFSDLFMRHMCFPAGPDVA
ncbi:MAG: ASKHA domain-containing protein [Kiritimatiellia bacterium]|jgi:uncharacterized 2Fe-2S/4Fe-4S cluster protein (DUF4445 family)|nr:ASKHA domain-containing protein [Kiritimatiellia bacterium]